MKSNLINVPRCALALLIGSCIFGGLFPFLNIELSFVILTPFRTVALFICCYCLGIWIKRFRNKQGIEILKKSKGEWLVFGYFIIWFLVGALWLVSGRNGNYAPTEVVGILTIGMIAFCVFTLVKDISDVQFLIKLCILSGIILCILAYFEAVFGSFVAGTKNYYSIEEKVAMGRFFFAPTTVFHNQNDFAAFISFCLSIICFWMLKAKNMRTFLIYLAIAIFMVIPVSLADSTIFYIVLLMLILFTGIILLVLKNKPFKIRALQVVAVVTASVLLATFGFQAVRDTAKHLNTQYHKIQISNKGYGDIGDGDIENPDGEELFPEEPDTLMDQLGAYKHNYGTIHIRIWLIRAGWDFFLDSPLLGCGPESFPQLMKVHEEYLKETRGIINPHFFYIELLSQYGILLFVAYMAISLFALIRSGVQAFSELRKGTAEWGVLSFILVVMFFVAVVMPSSAIRFTTLWIFFILAIAMVSKGKRQEKVNVSDELAQCKTSE